MSISPLLDLTRAKEFAIEPSQMRELLATFEQSLTQEIAIIQEALVSGDALKVEHSLHALKGFIPLFTTPALAKAVTDLYQTSRENTLDVTESIFTALVPNLKTLLDEVRACLGAL